jgi:phage tail-like protein
VAGIGKVSSLTRTSHAVTYREGGDPGVVRRSPGQTEFAAITLKQGVTQDAEFFQWANRVRDFTNSTASPDTDDQIVSLQDFRKDIVLELYNEAGQKVMAYNIYRCWPSGFTAMPELDADSNVVAIQTLTLEHEGWERDTSVSEPTEPGFVLPAP